MADLPRHDAFTRIGVNSVDTARTGSPSTWYWLPVFEDGVQLNPSADVQDINTEHKDRGIRYRVFTRRNAEAGSINTPLFPANAGIMFDAAISTTTGDITKFHTAESYWSTALAPSTNSGMQVNGMLFNGFTLAVDRNSPGPIEFQLDCFLNEYKAIASGSNPTPSWPPLNPNDSRNVYIDLDLEEAGFSGDNVDVRSVSLTYTNNIEVDVFSPSSTATLNGTWTKAYTGNPELNVEATLIVTDSTYPFLLDASTLRTAQLRIMGYNPDANGSSTTTDDESASASTVTFDFADASGFAVSDVVIFDDVDNGRQAVATITNIATDAVTVDALDVRIDGSGTTAANVYNTAWEIKVPEMEIVGASRPTVQGNVRVVNLQMRANLEATNTTILTHKAYNDDNT